MTVANDSGVIGVNPTIVLNRLRPGTAYVDVEMSNVDVLQTSDNVLSPMYRISCVIDDVTYMGAGLSKKVARANAAAEALEKGFGIFCTRTSSELSFILYFLRQFSKCRGWIRNNLSIFIIAKLNLCCEFRTSTCFKF